MSEPIDDAALVERFPYVRIDHDTKHLYRGWLDQRLLINRCDGAIEGVGRSGVLTISNLLSSADIRLLKPIDSSSRVAG